MHRTMALETTLLLALAGCGENLAGTWEGVCAFADPTYAYQADVELDITDGRGAILAGTIDLDMHDGQTFAGDVEGQRNRDWLQLEAQFQNSADQAFSFEITGDLDGKDIVGECRLMVPNGTGALVGEIELEQ